MIDVSTSGHHTGDCRELLKQLPDGCVQTCITSPPYWRLRDYGVEGQLGLESTPHEYVANMVAVFREVRRVLADDGTLWLNLGDSYCSVAGGYDVTGSRGATATVGAKTQSAVIKGRNRVPPPGLKAKDLVGVPWMVAFALREDGWYLRSDIIWAKPNPMPESVTDRPTKSHEHLFLFAKSERYYYNHAAITEPAVSAGTRAGYGGYSDRAASMGRIPTGNEKPGVVVVNGDMRNKRDVWTIATEPYSGAHFATMPPSLCEPCVLAGSRAGDVVLDPFFGSGTTGMVAEKHGRRWIGFDINPKYAELQKERTAQRSLVLGAQP